jgi:4a-hydroxytetrahydrobiopterin dehydratase
MTRMESSGTTLSRQAISGAVDGLGWRLVLGEVATFVRVESLARGAAVAAAAIAACGGDAGGHLAVDLRADRVALRLHTHAAGWPTRRDLELAGLISAAVADLGLATEPAGAGLRPVQAIEIAIDALDIPAVRPFWRAVLGYGDEPGNAEPDAAVVDPHGQGPAVWFQLMDAPRPQRNRIHLDISVPADELEDRLAAAVAAGGKVVHDAEAPAFWVLADPEGNEACLCTWQGRD